MTKQVSWGRMLGAGVAPPAVALAGSMVLLSRWSDELPDPLAVHFGVNGEADGFASLRSVAWSAWAGPAVALLLCLITAGMAGRDRRTVRHVVAAASGLGVALAILPALMAAPQRGVATAETVSLSPVALFGSLALAVVGAGLAALAVPRPEPVTAVGPPPVDAPRIPLAPGERVSWTGRAGMPWWVGLVPAGVVLVVLALSARSLVAMLVTVLAGVLVLVLLLAPVRVVVDESGLATRWLGVFRPTIPLAEVSTGECVRVGWLNRYGGFGYRVGPGGVGVIVRPGPALRVVRGDGSRFTVTVDGADQAAEVLNALAARGRVAG
ncbi:DUF1648 domain-containing protein [Rhodococcus kronopolitis]|uniref:DUF1648 domain-containing protein n=1 Tax=Rhodococcus kronopolitis TaxID=1460226 RepID=A0ABV9FWV0_9NOCA